jgi:serine protease Do
MRVFGFRMVSLVVLLFWGAGCAILAADRGPEAQLQARLETLEARLATLEHEAAPIAPVVTRARAAIALVWGTYTFVDEAGRPLRHVLDKAGEPIADPQGVPLVDLEGTGAVAVTNYSGTAFLVGPRGELLTNRHIAEPWWEDEASEPLLTAGLRPLFIRLRAFFPDAREAIPIEVIRVAAEQDIALVRTLGWTPAAEPLRLHPRPEDLEDGQPVLLMGYPTGLDALLAKIDDSERKVLEAETGPCSYATAEWLAHNRRLRPTITGGYLWEVLPHILVYDARTKGGGSGGPLLDRQGRVVGVNAAFLPEFMGGNFGVPIPFGQTLLAGGGLAAHAPTHETPELLAGGNTLEEQPTTACSVERTASGRR